MSEIVKIWKCACVRVVRRNAVSNTYVIYFEHTNALWDLLFIFVSRMFLHIILICSHCLFHSLYHQIFLYSVAEHIVTCFNHYSSTCSHSLYNLHPHTYHRLLWHTIFNMFLIFTLVDYHFNIYYLYHSHFDPLFLLITFYFWVLISL